MGAPPGSPDPNTAAHFMPSPLHAIVIVELPPLNDILKALEDNNPTPGRVPDGKAPSPGASSEDGQARQPPPPLPPPIG